MSETHSAYDTGELVNWQIEELLRSELTNIRVPEGADIDEVVGEIENNFITISRVDYEHVVVYIESEEHANQFGSDEEYERKFDTFGVYRKWHDEETGPQATVSLSLPYPYSSIVTEKMHEWYEEKRQHESPERLELWREQIPEDLQPSEEDRVDRIELPSVFETG